MGLLKAISKFWTPKSPLSSPGAPPDCDPLKTCLEQKKTTIDCRPDMGADTALGVKYACRYAWQIFPPAGWRRQDNTSGLSWPSGGVSPVVSFLNPVLPAGEQSLIRWQMTGVPESEASHRLLENLFSGTKALSVENVNHLEAPGLVKGMKVLKVEAANLPTNEQAVLVSTRLDQCKGEPPILRHVLIFPDRRLTCGDQTLWFRETLQFQATEESFWLNERLALESMRTFRRATQDQNGSYAVTPPVAPHHLSR